MKERGMIFNADMVRAILDGRKTQTRRIMKPQPEPCPRGGHWWPSNVFKTMLHVEDEMQNGKGGWGGLVGDACPFGDVGDRIWVRETFQGPLFDYDLMDNYCKDPTPFEKPEFCVYKADGVPAPEFYDADDELHCCWRPSIHMPRWASRILLEITDVRVERLNAISEEDARAEGIIDGAVLIAGNLSHADAPTQSLMLPMLLPTCGNRFTGRITGMLIPGFGLSSSSALKAVQHERRNHRSGQRAGRAPAGNDHPEHAHQSSRSFGYSLPRLRGRDTRAAQGTGGGMPALC